MPILTISASDYYLNYKEQVDHLSRACWFISDTNSSHLIQYLKEKIESINLLLNELNSHVKNKKIDSKRIEKLMPDLLKSKITLSNTLREIDLTEDLKEEMEIAAPTEERIATPSPIHYAPQQSYRTIRESPPPVSASISGSPSPAPETYDNWFDLD